MDEKTEYRISRMMDYIGMIIAVLSCIPIMILIVLFSVIIMDFNSFYNINLPSYLTIMFSIGFMCLLIVYLFIATIVMDSVMNSLKTAYKNIHNKRF